MKDAGNYIVPKLAKIPNCTEVTMAGKKLVFGKTIWQLEDSNHLLGDISFSQLFLFILSPDV